MTNQITRKQENNWLYIPLLRHIPCCQGICLYISHCLGRAREASHKLLGRCLAMADLHDLMPALVVYSHLIKIHVPELPESFM